MIQQYDHIAEGIRIRSKYDWYEHGGKSSKFYLNLEKKRGNQNQIRKLIFNEKDAGILNEIKHFYETLFDHIQDGWRQEAPPLPVFPL